MVCVFGHILGSASLVDGCHCGSGSSSVGVPGATRCVRMMVFMWSTDDAACIGSGSMCVVGVVRLVLI